MNSQPTTAQVTAIVELMATMAEAIKQSPNGIPSGELYAICMGHMTLATYNSIIDRLIGMKLVQRKYHLLTWVGGTV